MKKKIESVLCYPYFDRYVIRLVRLDWTLGGTPIPIYKEYTASYSDRERVQRLKNQYLLLNGLLQDMIIYRRTMAWEMLGGREQLEGKNGPQS